MEHLGEQGLGPDDPRLPGKQRSWGRRPTPPGALDWSIQGTRGEVTQDWIIHGSRARNRIVQCYHGEAKAVGKETKNQQWLACSHPPHLWPTFDSAPPPPPALK